MATILVTGSAGFIGFSLARQLMQEGHRVVGVDDLNPRFFPALKAERDRLLRQHSEFMPARVDLLDLDGLDRLFAEHRPQRVVHLAAMTGVRYSVSQPFLYQKTNIEGFLNILELCRRHQLERLVYASSSSVYGDRSEVPFRETDRVDTPVSLYAATKRADELMAHAYADLHGMSILGLRFFTVYGPWSRPDMATWIFAEKILAGEPLPIWNRGRMRRDFTYIDDIIGGTAALLFADLEPGHDVFNIGAGHAENLSEMIDVLERELGRTAERELLPMQPGDVLQTWADCSKLASVTGYQPAVSLQEGLPRFVAWYLEQSKLAAAVRTERAAFLAAH